jgi:hypothetical protein
MTHRTGETVSKLIRVVLVLASCFLSAALSTRGDRDKSGTVTQAQIAATVAALLGKDYPHDVPAAAQPLPDLW